jgi:hypothetical protein
MQGLFFERKPWGNAPGNKKKYIKKEETKLQGGTYVRPNQWLGNERGLAKKEKTDKITGARQKREGATKQQSSTTRKL